MWHLPGRLTAIAVLTCLATGVLADPAPADPALPKNRNVLFWNDQERDAGFRAMEKVFPTRTVSRGEKVQELAQGAPLSVPNLDQYMTNERTAAIVVLQDGRARLEAYRRNFDAAGRWTSFSVAKSFTSTLVGAAVRDGYIRSIEDDVTAYIPELKGSGYEGVNIRQILTMTSGVRWSEDYADRNSDVARFLAENPTDGSDPTVSYLRRLPREAEPGTKWVYKTGETNLIGVLVTRATKKTLADYLAEKVWRPYGMEQDAAWVTTENGQEIGGCCMSLAARDYARMGQFILDGGQGVLPEGWLAQATRKQADIGQPGFGYGFQWWTRDDGTFAARGIFGQMVNIDPARRLVTVILSDWDKATTLERSITRERFLKTIAAAADAR